MSQKDDPEGYLAALVGAVSDAAGLTMSARLDVLFASDFSDELLIWGVVSSLSLATGLSVGAAPVGGEALLILASFCFSSALKAWYACHFVCLSSGVSFLVCAKLRRACSRCLVLKAAHSVMRKCNVA